MRKFQRSFGISQQLEQQPRVFEAALFARVSTAIDPADSLFNVPELIRSGHN
jgi:hypothetical protein